MNDLITIGGVRGYVDETGTAQLNLEDVSRGLGFTQTAKSGNEVVRWERVSQYLKEFGFVPIAGRIIPTCGDDVIQFITSICDSSQQVGRDTYIPENIFYRLAMKARNEVAEKFQAKVADEILPTIRKTGAYITNRANPEMLRNKADEIESMSALNEAARIILPVLEEAGLKPQYRAIALKQIYRKGGMDLPIEEMKAERELFDLTTIAKKVGIYSKSDKPHGQAIGAIIQRLSIEDSEKELVTFENNGHSGTAIQYIQSVIEKVRKWLEDNSYPTLIPFMDSTGKEKTYTVNYKSVPTPNGVA